MSDDYTDILNQSWDNIPLVQVLPVGSWLLRLRTAVYQPSKQADGDPIVMFVYSVKEPMEDVDVEELAKLGDNYDYGANRIFWRKYINDNASWDEVRKHLGKHGVEVKGSIKESFDAAKGSEVIAYLNQRSYTTNAGEGEVSNEPSQFAKVE